MSLRASELTCTMPRTRSRFSSSVTTRRVWPVETARRSAVSTSSDRSTVTTAGIGVITWRASCSCRWKTPCSIPASPGSSLPPTRAWAMSTRSSSGLPPSSNSALGLTPSARSIPLDARLSPEMNGRIALLNQMSGRATRSATGSALTIAKILGTCSPTVMCSVVTST